MARFRVAFSVLLLCSVGALTALAAGGGAGASAPAFTPPPLQYGEKGWYLYHTGTVNLTIEETPPTLDKAARLVPAFNVRVTSNFPGLPELVLHEHVSLATMTIERTVQECAVIVDDQCEPWEHHRWWNVQGTGGVHESTLLQGRTFRIGDAWSVEGECGLCVSPTRVDILSPSVQSPPGTAYVARLSHHYEKVGTPRTTLHMGVDHAMPLLVERTGKPNATLVQHEQGAGAAVPTPTPPAPASYPQVLAPQPFEQGRPVEGTPIPGMRAWSEARNATGPDARDLDPSLVFRSVQYRRTIDRTTLPTGEVVLKDEHVIRAAYGKADARDVATTYRHTRTLPDTPVEPFASRGWWTENSTAPASALGTCTTEGVPFWDSIRILLGTGLIARPQGFDLEDVGACDEYLVWLLGDGLGGTKEHLAADLPTGHLASAHVIVR